MKAWTYFAAGLLFSVGLVFSGMTQPSKVVGFLDFFGDWDPSLIFVMGGAILTHAPLYRLITKRPTPIFSRAFFIPTRVDIDGRLVLGAALFGAGWGLAGYCPGPALVSTVSMSVAPYVFVASMILGMIVFRAVDVRLSVRAVEAAKKEVEPIDTPRAEAHGH